MGSPKPEPAYRGAHVRPILLIYTLLMVVGNSYSMLIEEHPLMEYQSTAMFGIHALVMCGVLMNTEGSLRATKRALKLFMLLYICNILALPVLVSSFRASGSLNSRHPGELFEKFRGFFKTHNEVEQSEMEKQLDQHTKNQILHVFRDNDTQKKVETMFLDVNERKYLMKVAESPDFKAMVAQGFHADNFVSNVVFNKIAGDISRKELMRAGIWSGYGIELACLLTLALIVVLHHMVEILWVHAVAVHLSIREEFSHY